MKVSVVVESIRLLNESGAKFVEVTLRRPFTSQPTSTAGSPVSVSDLGLTVVLSQRDGALFTVGQSFAIDLSEIVAAGAAQKVG